MSAAQYRLRRAIPEVSADNFQGKPLSGSNLYTSEWAPNIRGLTWMRESEMIASFVL